MTDYHPLVGPLGGATANEGMPVGLVQHQHDWLEGVFRLISDKTAAVVFERRKEGKEEWLVRWMSEGRLALWGMRSAVLSCGLRLG